MTFLNFRISFFFAIGLAGLAFSGCRPRTKELTSPPHYDFSQVYTDKLDLKVQEISGLAWDSKDNVFYVVNDELGKLFTLDKESKVINGEYDFGSKGDYEDVAMLNDIPYILRSDGTIFRFVKDNEGKTSSMEMGKVPLQGTNDFETMYSDPEHNALVLICKNCERNIQLKIANRMMANQ